MGVSSSGYKSNVGYEMVVEGSEAVEYVGEMLVEMVNEELEPREKEGKDGNGMTF